MPKDLTDEQILRKRLRAQGFQKVTSNLLVTLGQFTQPDPTRVLGIDTSHWTGIVDWEAAKAGGISFAIIKYMDGTQPSHFAEINYSGAIDAGVLVGSYQWLRAEYPEGRQAREYAAMLKHMPTNLPPAVDYESSPRGKKFNPTIDNLYSIIVPLLALLQRSIMLYTSIGYWNQYGSVSPLYKRCHLWQAQYKTHEPSRMLPWMQWDFWQFTETGEGAKYGVPRSGERAVDLNYWRGSFDELRLWCGRPS